MTGSSLTPYDYDDAPPPAGPEVSERSRAVALILQILGGPLGLHRFYVGRRQTGILMAITLGGMGLWWMYDLVILLAGEFRDADDRPLRNWGVSEPSAMGGGASGEVRHLAEQLEALRHEVGDLAERLDFAERMLAQRRERDRLSPS